MLSVLLNLSVLASPAITHDCDGLGTQCCMVLDVPHGAPLPPARRCDEQNIIDMLWVVNAPALDYMGGPAAVLAEVHIAMNKANEAFINSQLPFSTRLVGLHVTQYDWNSDYLYDLQNPNDGQMDEVHVIRDAKAADLVALITIDGYCGVAFVSPNDPAYGFQGNSADCLLMDWASPMRHELGHNLGSMHYTDTGGYFPWSAGHILTLNDDTTVGTCMAGNHIGHYSNPYVSWLDVPTGIPPGYPGQADNRHTFTQTVPMVSTFRCSVDACPADTNFNGVVDTDDVLAVLSAWGPAAATPADVVLNGQADVDDLLLVVSTWGDCP